MKMYSKIFILLLASFSYALEDNSVPETPLSDTTTPPMTTPTLISTTDSETTLFVTEIVEVGNSTTEFPKTECTCGIFLSDQFKKGSKDQPKGNPALLKEFSEVFPCNSHGNKLCSNKCLDIIVKHLPRSSDIVCGTIDRDCVRERAYLFIKNCKDEWVNTNLSAGREYCCKDGLPYKCPVPS